MAKKKETISLSDSLSEFKDLRGIDAATLSTILEDSFRNVISKQYGSDENFEVYIDAVRGGIEIYRTRTVVGNGEVVREMSEIELKAARAIDPELEIGESCVEPVDLLSFGRRIVINLRQALSSKILELQKENFAAKFSSRVGELVSAEVYQVWKREVLLIDDEGNELILPKSEQIPGDFFRKGDTVRAIIAKVENEGNPRVILSRVSGLFLSKLLELNVPEIADGLITIKAVARIPGDRAKIAVESYDDRIDPVGACVGMNGSRIRGVVRELRNENIDVTPYTTNEALFIQRALSPAKLATVVLDSEEVEVDGVLKTVRTAEVYLRPDQVPLAIGKNASNLKLACLLTSYKIEIFRDEDNDGEEDIYLDEFTDEIEEWVINTVKNAGFTTAKSVLRKTREELKAMIDLEEDTIEHLYRVLEEEFAEDPEQEDQTDTDEAEESTATE